ncbi:MAG: hypothetical protein EBS05_03450 [Proteobacteria bacterium]|nr:hypothetical protein [Pseudomonadota bacterium]
MRSLSCRSKFLLGGALSLACVASASAQVSSQATGAASATLRPGGLREGLTTTTLSEKADAEVGGAGTTEPSLVRDADAAQQGFFRTFQDGIIRVPKIGYGEGQFRVAAPLGPTAGLPLFGFASRPEEAQFKLGNFYLQVFSLSTSALVSDNINLVQVGRKTDEIAIVRLQTGVIYQVNEAMRLSAAGTAIWLPLKGEVGFRDPLADYSFSLAPLFQTQFTYDIPMNHLDFQVLEDFTVQSGGFGTGRAFDLLDRQANDLQDTAGRYSYRDTQAQGATDRRFRSAPSFRNVIGANASTVLPTVTRFTAGYTHENI